MRRAARKFVFYPSLLAWVPNEKLMLCSKLRGGDVQQGKEIAAAFKSFRETCPNIHCTQPRIVGRICVNCNCAVDEQAYEDVYSAGDDETEDEHTSEESDDEDDFDYETLNKSCFNEYCKNPNPLVAGVCEWCGVLNQCTNKYCDEPAVKNGHCLNCFTIIDQSLFDRIKNRPCRNLNCPLPQYQALYGRCMTCHTSYRCRNNDCRLPEVRGGLCFNCNSHDRHIPHSLTDGTAIVAPGFREGLATWTTCTSCDNYSIRNGRCQCCARSIPICSDDDCKSYNTSQHGFCLECGADTYGEENFKIYRSCVCENETSQHTGGICDFCGYRKSVLENHRQNMVVDGDIYLEQDSGDEGEWEDDEEEPMVKTEGWDEDEDIEIDVGDREWV